MGAERTIYTDPSGWKISSPEVLAELGINSSAIVVVVSLVNLR